MLVPRPNTTARLSQRWRDGLCWQCKRSFASTFNAVAEGDHVLLQAKNSTRAPVFTKRLRHSRKTESWWGSVDHTSIIGKRARDVVHTSRGREIRVNLPTLEEYVTLTPRIVTPIYPADANLIVSLLDIHVTPTAPTAQDDAPLEVLEAGTGHGALTLHLARAIHAANPRLSPDANQDGLCTGGDMPSSSGVDVSTPNLTPNAQVSSSEIEEYKSQRKAIIHTLDISSRHSDHAKRVVAGFRQGLYASNVDFHVGDISEWIQKQFTARAESQADTEAKAFLSHIILDLPSSHRYIAQAASALHVNGCLLVFNPSITQITQCVEKIQNERLPLILDRVLELGAAMTGGRRWDVRSVRPRALVKPETEKEKDLALTRTVETGRSDESIAGSGDVSINVGSDGVGRNEEQAQTLEDQETGWEMICRPKVGEMLTGGGFLGVWKKMRDRTA
ncbi:MAG: hypothetical protein FRX48_00043 [Lasallia pustulata]|uniref:tRNA (adenine(58)-N(1))-methyltransferase catalytic subunit TRM61 n=1 Tax=Lasallia pustulata TaxID=136370 RepID=A0A5M8PZU2_9LECA|nr:MAG: hypothetical protein FRX48_00043 [Lasallia pustulata]